MLDVQLFSFIAVATVLVITPGADTMVVLRNTLSRGSKAGLITMLGICSGLLVHASFSVLGLSLILTRSTAIFYLVKLGGACYLFWLGVQSLISAARRGESRAAESVGGGEAIVHSDPNGLRRAFLEGLLTNLLNPKVALFYLSFLPQFIRPDDPILPRTLVLTGIHLMLSVMQLSSVSLLVEWIKGLVSSPKVTRAMEALAGTSLIGLGVRLTLERR